jgi:phospholipase/carboxylesterase
MWTRHDDLPLRYVMSVPSGSDGPLPLVICMHGRGADMNDLADIAPALDGGFRFLFPNAARPFEPMPGYSVGWSWFDGWPPEPPSIAESRALVLEFLDAAVARYPPPAGKMILSGFSQGALMAFDCGFRTTQPVAGIVAMSGALFEEELPPLRPLPVLIAHGLADDVVPVLHARHTRHVLENHGLHPEYHEFPIGHSVSMEELAVVKDFLVRTIGKQD